MVYIDTEAARYIHLATHNNHPEGLIHPKRIMNTHVILYGISGNMEIYEDGTPYTIYENDVRFLCGGVLHYGEKMCEPNTKLYALHLTLSENDRYSPEDEPCSAPIIKIAPLIHCGDSHDVKLLFQDIVNTFWGESGVKDIKLSYLINLLLIRLSECSCANSAEDALARECAMYINTHMERISTPTELARHFMISEKKLRTIFLRVYGKTPYTYQRDVKMKHAARLLGTEPDMLISKIASSVGYANEFYFTKVFHQCYGESPRDYCRRIKGESQTGADASAVPEIVMPDRK